MTSADRFDRARAAAIAAAIACVAVVGTGLSLSIPCSPSRWSGWACPTPGSASNTAVAGVASIVVVPFVPRIAARLGVMPLLLGSLAVGGAALVGFKALHGFAWWFPLRLCFSAALGVLFVLSEFWINQAAPPARRGLVMGIYHGAGPRLRPRAGAAGVARHGRLAALPRRGGAVRGRGGCRCCWPAASCRRTFPGRCPRLRRLPRIAPSATLAALVYGAVETGGFADPADLRLAPRPRPRGGGRARQRRGARQRAVPDPGRPALRPGRPAPAAPGRRPVRRLGALALPLGAGSTPLLWAILLVWGGIAGTFYTVGLAHLGARFEGAALAGANAAFLVLYNVGLVLGPPVVGGGMDPPRRTASPGRSPPCSAPTSSSWGCG